MATSAVAQAPVIRRQTQTGDKIARLVVLGFATLLLSIAVVLVLQLWIGSAPARQSSAWVF